MMMKYLAAVLFLFSMPFLCDAQESEKTFSSYELREDLERLSTTDYLGKTALILTEKGDYAFNEKLDALIGSQYLANKRCVILKFITESELFRDIKNKMYSSPFGELKYKKSGIFNILDGRGPGSDDVFYVKLRDVEAGEILYYSNPTDLLIEDHITYMNNKFNGRHYIFVGLHDSGRAILVESQQRSIILGRKTFEVSEFAAQYTDIARDVQWECIYSTLETKKIDLGASKMSGKVIYSKRLLSGFLLTDEAGNRIFYPEEYTNHGALTFERVFMDVELHRIAEEERQRKQQAAEEARKQQEAEEARKRQEAEEARKQQIEEDRRIEEQMRQAQEERERQKKLDEERKRKEAAEREKKQKEEGKKRMSTKLKQL